MFHESYKIISNLVDFLDGRQCNMFCDRKRKVHTCSVSTSYQSDIGFFSSNVVHTVFVINYKN